VAEAIAFEKLTVTVVVPTGAADTSVGATPAVKVVVDGFGLIVNPVESWTFRTVRV
jgi:hypothetical protein